MSLKKVTYNKIGIIITLSAVIMVVNWMINPAQSSANSHVKNILDYEMEIFPPDSPEIDLPYPFKDGLGGPKNQNTEGCF